MTLAIRVWHWPEWAAYAAGGLAGGLRIGDSQLMEERLATRVREVAWDEVADIFMAILETLAALAAMAFFVFRPQEREYLWFGVMLLFSSGYRCQAVSVDFHRFGIVEHDLLQQLILAGRSLAAIAFYFTLLRGKRDWLFWSAVGSVIALLAIVSTSLLEASYNLALLRELSFFFLIPQVAWTTKLVVKRSIEGLLDARLLLAPVLLIQLVAIINWVFEIGEATNWYHVPSDWFYETAHWPFDLDFYEISGFLFLVAMLSILIHRFTRTRQLEQNYEREREAARTVQQVIIPDALPEIPGLSIASVYSPFGEVGGDFFQVLPIGDGAHANSVLIAIGDVSGKGLPAAMTVSLLVGTFRTLAHYTKNPGEVLASMNQRMIGRNSGGFTTCLVVRLDPDGTLTMANAGHISPYLNGRELAGENGLPLGLIEDAAYMESIHTLGPHDHLTLLTDGVVEARSKSGELFGFDRTAAIAMEPAESIAETAQNFGQDDDITVLSLTRVTVNSPSVA